jgi:hypothetical protein
MALKVIRCFFHLGGPYADQGMMNPGKSKPWARKKKECTFIPEKIVFYWNLWCRFTPKLA